jgi:hypothetical protein
MRNFPDDERGRLQLVPASSAGGLGSAVANPYLAAKCSTASNCSGPD